MSDGSNILCPLKASVPAYFAGNKLGRRLATLCAPFTVGFLLLGCALPIPLQIASWAIDGISYIATDKSILDHGISTVSNQDCAMFRIVTQGVVCRVTITDKVKNAIFLEYSLQSAEIDVKTFKGVVQLSGFVNSQAGINRAVIVTQNIKGVKSVQNHMQLKNINAKIDPHLPLLSQVSGASTWKLQAGGLEDHKGEE